jgi:hypothetical protein
MPVNKLSTNLTSVGVDDRHLEALIVSEAVVTKMPCKLIAALDSLEVAFKVDPDPVSHRDAILLIEKDFFAFYLYLRHQCDVSGFVPNVTPQPFLTFEQHAKR